MELGSAEAVDATETNVSFSTPELRKLNSSVLAGDSATAAKPAADGDGGVGGDLAFGCAFDFGAGVGIVVIVVGGSSAEAPEPVTSSVRCVSRSCVSCGWLLRALLFAFAFGRRSPGLSNPSKVALSSGQG